MARRPKLVRCNKARTEHFARVKILAFGWTKGHHAFCGLAVARRNVIKDGVAADIFVRPLSRDVFAGLGDVNAELELIVELLGIARPQDVCSGTNDILGVCFPIDRNFIPDVGDLVCTFRPSRAFLMLFKSAEIADGVRPGNGGEEPDLPFVPAGLCSP